MPHLSHFIRPTSALLAAVCCMMAPQTSTAQDPALPDVEGKWAQLQVTTGISDVLIVGDVRSTTTALLILDIDQNGKKLDIRETVCDIRIDSTTKRVRTVVPEAFQRAASGLERRGRLVPTDDGFLFEEYRKWVVLGANLKDMKKDALPDDEDDPRLVDADRDGHPGLTVQIRGVIDGEVYVAQRSWSHLKGPIDGERIKGRIRWRSEQSVVDSTSMLLGDSPPSKPDKRGSHNFFRMRKLADDTSCKDVVRQRGSLFK